MSWPEPPPGSDPEPTPRPTAGRRPDPTAEPGADPTAEPDADPTAGPGAEPTAGPGAEPPPGRAAIVTGASRGIGRGIALALAGAGFDVVVNYARDAKAAREVAERVAAAGGRAHPVRADIAVAADRERLVEESYRACGRIDLLVNNAGVAPRVRADLLEADEASFDEMIGVNLKGPYFLTQLVARRMVAQVREGTVRQPKIVTISSISAYTASVNRGDYCLAKAGLAMLTKLYAARLAEHGVQVFEIRPGIVETDMTGPVRARYDRLIHDGLTPIRRWGRPEDVGRAVLAVATDLLPFSTGQVIDVDGGFHLRTL
jgi:NAD(P)-dependent dehydrogenase (short-subunit alcohol dehydrogenase family)